MENGRPALRSAPFDSDQDRVPSKLTAAAIEPAMSVGYDDFASQVLAYLEPEYQDHYRSRKTWERTQDAVVHWLESQAKP